MPDPATILRIADRVEREPPSRELDAEIHCAVSDFVFLGMQDGGYLHDWPKQNIRRSVGYSWPHYTTSLDAAVTLVPEHHSYELTFSAAGDGAMRRARLWDWRRNPPAMDPGNCWEAVAGALPSALCAAALRAIAAGEPTG